MNKNGKMNILEKKYIEKSFIYNYEEYKLIIEQEFDNYIMYICEINSFNFYYIFFCFVDLFLYDIFIKCDNII